MIIERMVATFGKLDNQELRLQPGVNVLTGENESGKSTWLAFLLAMLYGVDTRERSKSGRLPDKLRYQPWSGKPMAGLLELEADGRALALERTSRSTPMGEFRAWDRDTGTPREDLTGKTCGQTLLGVEVAVYLRSAYLRQQRISVSADAALERRLSSLVTAGSEDFSYAEVDERLKKMQHAIRHNQSGALPRAEEALSAINDHLKELGESRHQLAALEAELKLLKGRRQECREILSGLDALDLLKRQSHVTAAEAALAEAREDQEAWASVCAGLPDETLLQDLEAELRQLQNELQHVALEEGLNAAALELKQPDPVFGRMNAREAHDKAAADATLIQEAKSAEAPRPQSALPWYLTILLGLALSLTGVLSSLSFALPIGIVLALGGLGMWIWQRISFDRRNASFRNLQREAKRVLTQYGAESARDVVLSGIRYIQSLEAEESSPDGGAARKQLEALAARRTALYARLDALMPGCSDPEKAAVLFQEAKQARQSYRQAQLLEQQRGLQLQELRNALGESKALPPDAARYADCDRDAVTERMEDLDRRIVATSSRADKLAGAMDQMGDPLAMEAERAGLEQEIRRLEERYAALRLARHALMEADEHLRARFSPMLCDLTGKLFSRLTGGRYDKVQLDRELHVTVHPADSPVYRPLSYLSEGTVDQLYLALRLAICELLLPQAPIILDDALVYFDDTRLRLALETLRELGRTRQILLFSCQDREQRILDELARRDRKLDKAAEAELDGSAT